MVSALILSVCLFFQHSSQSLQNSTIQRVPVVTDKDSVEMVKTVQSFLLWYKENYQKISSIRLIKTDDKGFYRVDLENVEKYLHTLQSSGYISSEYLRLWRDYFYSRVEYFHINPQNEGPPEGFDYDLVVLTQEPELLWNKREELLFSFLQRETSKATLSAAGEWPHVFELSKVRGKWLIDYIYIEEPE